MDEPIIFKDVKVLLSKLDISKRMGHNEIDPKISKYLPNESFINSIYKLSEKCIEYEMIPYIWKTAIVIPLHIFIIQRVKTCAIPCPHQLPTTVITQFR